MDTTSDPRNYRRAQTSVVPSPVTSFVGGVSTVRGEAQSPLSGAGGGLDLVQAREDARRDLMLTPGQDPIHRCWTKPATLTAPHI